MCEPSHHLNTFPARSSVLCSARRTASTFFFTSLVLSLAHQILTPRALRDILNFARVLLSNRTLMMPLAFKLRYCNASSVIY